jgi:hypothetical protein
MKKSGLVVSVLFIFILLAVAVLAENDTLVVNSTINDSINVSNDTVVSVNVSSASIIIRNFIPTKVNVGDVQLSINVQNIGNSELTSLGAFVSGDGFSSYDVVPIDSLKPQEKSYILVSGNFKKAGSINLTIRINQEVFYEVVSVVDSSVNVSIQFNQQLEDNIGNNLAVLKQNYSELESALQIKKSEGYDVSGINLNDLKVMIRDAQSNLLSGNLDQANVKVDLAREEYFTQYEKLTVVKKISLGQKLKDNAVLFSTLAGAIITFFTLYELLKKKKETLSEKIRSIKVKDKNGNTLSVKTK